MVKRAASLPSSLAAQAPSAIGSSRIAARFADIPKCNSFLIVCPRAWLTALRRILDCPPAKWNSHLGYRANVRFMKQYRPAAIGEAMARAGLISTVAAGNVEQATPEESASAALGGGRDVFDRGLRD